MILDMKSGQKRYMETGLLEQNSLDSLWWYSGYPIFGSNNQYGKGAGTYAVSLTNFAYKDYLGIGDDTIWILV